VLVLLVLALLVAALFVFALPVPALVPVVELVEVELPVVELVELVDVVVPPVPELLPPGEPPSHDETLSFPRIALHPATRAAAKTSNSVRRMRFIVVFPPHAQVALKTDR
jgi:hypothetical protein